MSRRDIQRLADITAAIEAISAHLQRGDISDGPRLRLRRPPPARLRDRRSPPVRVEIGAPY